MPLDNEKRIMAGLCCDCDAPIKPWTWEDIQLAKADMGMGADDDFADCCAECGKKYMPQQVAAKPLNLLDMWLSSNKKAGS